MNWLGMLKTLLISTLLILGCTKDQVTESNGYSIDAYFCPEDDCMSVLINLTRSASSTICAFYDLDLPELIEALDENSAMLVLDNKNYYANEDILSRLSDRIKVAIPNHQMHNKFCIFETDAGKIVATGSFNPTQRGNYKNNNNLIVIHSQYLAQNYGDEFDELWSGTYGDGKKIAYPYIILNGNQIRNYFCPEDCSPEIYTSLISSANSSVYFMTFSFTQDEIGDALIAAHERGVSVSGVFEKSQNSKYCEYQKLLDAGIDVYLDTNPANMHHKVFIIDEKIVITGSANPSNNGIMNNDENIIVLHDPQVALDYMEEYRKIKNIIASSS